MARTTHILLVFSLLLFYSIARTQSARSLVRDGNRAYEANKFADAEIDYRKALEANKTMEEGAFNLGDALYKQDRHDEAADFYRNSVTSSKGPVIRAHAYHNLGNALLKGGKLPESIEAYKNALKLNPADVDTKYNLEYAKAMLKQQQQNQQQNKDKKENDKQEKDKQKQNQQKGDQEKKEKQDKQEQQKQNEARNEKGQQQGKEKKQQISKETAERILEALKNEERDVQKRLQKKVPARIKIEKDW